MRRFGLALLGVALFLVVVWLASPMVPTALADGCPNYPYCGYPPPPRP